MADIKTRSHNNGSIKTLDRSIQASNRIRDAASEIRQTGRSYVYAEDNSVDEYTSGRLEEGMQNVLYEGEIKARMIASKTHDAVQAAMRKETIKKHERSVAADKATKGTIKTRELKKAGTSTANFQNQALASFRSRKSAQNVAQATERVRRTTEQSVKRAKKIADAIAKSARALTEASRKTITAIVAGGSSVAIVLIVCILFCSAFCVWEDANGEIQVYSEEELESYEEGDLVGCPNLVVAARSHLGNVGGNKFWRWYGFKSHVAWCACFVSYCEAQCGYIKSKQAPKFAVVGNGADWFKKEGLFKGRKYKPSPGNIIFFDWYGNGTRDHVGIVESCDGKRVYTIEGNTRNMCKRRSYPVGWYEIYGYGIIDITGH